MFIISFYSYKGGVGRTATLLNTAWYMALRGRRVALLDLDLEAPGLSSACLLGDPDKPVSEVADSVPGICELVGAYRENNQRFPDRWHKRFFMQGLGPQGRLGLMAAGDIKSAAYEPFIQSFSWHDFYTQEFGGSFMVGITRGLAALGYEYLLIDARTGVTDVSHITTLQLPDLVVLVTNLTRQSLDGIARRIDIIEDCNQHCLSADGCAYRKPGYERRPVEIILAASPLPRGEWKTRRERIREAEANIFNKRRIDIEIDYLDLLAVGERDQILFRKMDEHDLDANAFLAAATHPYQRLGDEIARRNPESPENLVEDGTRLWEMGLWRIAKAHHDEAMERITKHEEQFSRWTASSEQSQPSASNPAFQEAELGWLFADLESLNPDEDRKRLEDLERHKPATKSIRVQRARAWLALAFRYILLNLFQDSAKAAWRAAEAFCDLLKEEGEGASTRPLKDLHALALLRSGYACMLASLWDLAAKRTRESRNIYRHLAARPLLLSLASCQLARIELAVGADGAMERARESIGDAEPLIRGATSLPVQSGIAHSAEILNQHVQADFYHARAVAHYEQGNGYAARLDFEKSYALYSEDEDVVGQLDLLVPQLSLGMLGFGIGQESEFFDHRLSEWIELANRLRVPSSAWRLELGSWSLGIALGSADGAIEKCLRDFLQSHQEPSVDAQIDPALSTLARLEIARFFLVRGSDDDVRSAKEMLELARKDGTETAESTGYPDITPEVAHPSLLLEGVLAITDAKVAAPNLIQRLQAQAASWGKKGYRLREAQLRLLLALMDPTNHLQTLQAVLDGTDGIAAPEEWAWTLPLVFVFSSRNDRLKNACSRLRAACEEHEGLYEKIWRGPPRNAS
jgi:Mrp family chromosome partitioning ATPase